MTPNPRPSDPHLRGGHNNLDQQPGEDELEDGEICKENSRERREWERERRRERGGRGLPPCRVELPNLGQR